MSNRPFVRVTWFKCDDCDHEWQRLHEQVDGSSCPECLAFSKKPYSTEEISGWRHD